MYQNLNNLKVNIYTLGCKVNQYESDAIMEDLQANGCVSVESDADVCIINTCSVTNMADRKSRQMIHRMKKNNPKALIIATGCYVQASSDDLIKDDSIDILISNNKKIEIPRIISEYLENGYSKDCFIDINKEKSYEDLRISIPETHTRAYMKIQDGCNNFCTYCIIPYVRGRIRSRKLADIISEANTLAENGVKEIVLTGINLSSYDDSQVDSDLADVIYNVAQIDGIERIRLSSLEPRVITEDFLNRISSIDKLCPHFHLSMQSACNKTLKAMNRKYTIEEYMAACDLLKKYYDRPALTTDVIVGFPGETDEDFETTFSNIKKIGFYELHVFKYSRRKGTVADKMPDQIDERIKTARSDILLDYVKECKLKYEGLFKGEELDVLVEEVIYGNNSTYLRGHTDRYILIDIPYDKAVSSSPDELINKTIRYKY